MKRLAILVLLVLGMVGCKSTEKNTKVYQPEPSWIASTPVNSNYYIGIFGTQKTTSDYRTAAKKGALDNLSSEISVNISGESVLHSLEKNGVFDQEFKQNIKISTQKNLEGYELVSTWEGANEYWVYYRLSKAEYARLKQAKLDAVLNKAKDQFSRAKVKHKEFDYSQAFSLSVQALESVSGYLDTPLKTEFEGREVFFATEVLSFLQSITDELAIVPSFKSKSVKLGDELTGKTVYVNVVGKNNKAVNGIPILSEYKALLSNKERTKTDLNGKAQMEFGVINQSKKSQTITSQIDFQRLSEASTNHRMVLALLKYLPVKTCKSTLTVNPPKVYIVSKERELGRKIKTKLAGGIKQTLISKGFEVTNYKKNADLILVITGNTEDAGVNRGAHVVYFKGSIEVFKKTDNSLVFSQQIKQEKGMQLVLKRASEDAYVKAGDFIKRRIIPKLSNQYFSF